MLSIFFNPSPLLSVHRPQEGGGMGEEGEERDRGTDDEQLVTPVVAKSQSQLIDEFVLLPEKRKNLFSARDPQRYKGRKMGWGTQLAVVRSGIRDVVASRRCIDTHSVCDGLQVDMGEAASTFLNKESQRQGTYAP